MTKSPQLRGDLWDFSLKEHKIDNIKEIKQQKLELIRSINNNSNNDQINNNS